MEGRSDRGIGSRLSEPATYSVSPISRNPNPRHRDLMDFRPWLRAARQAILRPLLIQVRRGAVCAVGRAATNNLPRGELSLRVLKMQSTKSEERSTKNPGCFVRRSSLFVLPTSCLGKFPPAARLKLATSSKATRRYSANYCDAKKSSMATVSPHLRARGFRLVAVFGSRPPCGLRPALPARAETRKRRLLNQAKIRPDSGRVI
jgi:hypothetical protein